MATITLPKGATEAQRRIGTPDEFRRIMSDPVYFVDQYCYTFDPLPRAEGHHLMPFRLYDFQKDTVTDIVNHIRQGRDLFIEKSRDMGISWIMAGVTAWFWNFDDGFQAVFGSRLEDAVDNNLPDSLFGKLDIILDNLPFEPEGYRKDKYRTRLRLINPANGNAIKGESSNPNWSRSGRYKLGFMDELAFWQDAAEAWGGAQDACSCVIAVTTPPSKPHFSKALRKSGIVEVKTLHWRQHPLKDEVWYAKEKDERLPEDLAREVDINWEGSITGRVYHEIDHCRMGDFPYMPQWPLYVSWDFGHDPDPMSIQWYQVNPENGRYRLIESFEKNKSLIDWFMPMFGHPFDSTFSYNAEENHFADTMGGMKRAIHFGDPAGRQGNAVSGKSIIERLNDFGIVVNCNTMANDLESRKSYARRMLMNLDINDTPNNRYFLECIKNARYPDVSENSSRITANDKPLHDWTSHHRSSMEYFSVNINYERVDPGDYVAGLTFNKVLSRVQSMQTDQHIIGNE